MRRQTRISILGLLLVLFICAPLGAQTTATAPAVNAVATSAPAGQAPDEMTKKISDLVHAGNYAEAQQLTNGLLAAYPDDQRLIKAKALIEKLSAAPATTTPASQPAPPASAAAPLTGMDKVDYSALIVLARQAQQDTDLTEQKKLLQQFMEQSAVFLQKHPDQMQLWQLRGASALILNQPMEGYDAGQKLLAAGAADSNDPNLQTLLGQLKNKGWLDKQEVERQASYGWINGTWSASCLLTDKHGKPQKCSIGKAGVLNGSTNNSVVELYYFDDDGTKHTSLRGTILDSGEITWERHWNSEWKATSVDVSSDKKSVTWVFTEQFSIGQGVLKATLTKQ